MPYTVEHLPDEPIVVVTFEGKIDADLILEADQHINAAIQRNGVNSVLIFDTTHAETDFTHMMGILRATTGDWDAEPADAPFEVLVAFVGTSAMVKLYVDGARQKQYGGRQLPLFASLDDALPAMRIALAQLTERRIVG